MMSYKGKVSVVLSVASISTTSHPFFTHRKLRMMRDCKITGRTSRRARGGVDMVESQERKALLEPRSFTKLSVMERSNEHRHVVATPNAAAQYCEVRAIDMD